MALMKAALAWERFILKDLTTVAKYAKVELMPSADVGGLVRGVGGLVKDAATFKWAQVLSPQFKTNLYICLFFRPL